MIPNRVTTGILHAVLALAALAMADPASSADENFTADGSSGSSSALRDNAAGTASPAACCSCRVTESTALQPPPMLPCTFDYPAGWDARFGDDGALISAVIGAECGASCGISPSQSFSIADGPDQNAEMREEIWSGMINVVGKGDCGDRAVTFFESPGSDPDGQFGSVQFYVGYGGELYSANAMFTCPIPGEWQELRDLFIDSFRTNPQSTFGRD